MRTKSPDTFLGYDAELKQMVNTVSTEEWVIANHLLADKPVGTKLRNYAHGKELRSHVFIFLNNKVYVLSNIDHHRIKESDENQEEITEIEWDDAKNYFKKNPEASKLHHYSKIHLKFLHENKYTELNHSFVKLMIDGREVICALSGNGHGELSGTAKVKIAVDIKGNFYALKLPYKYMLSEKGLGDINTEIEMSAAVDFLLSDTVKSYFTPELVRQPILVLPYFQMDFFNWMQATTRNKAAIANFLIAMLFVSRDLQQLHEKNILHLDVKPENILVKMDGDNIKSARLCDFGYAGFAENGVFVSDLRGTEGYLAPEIQGSGIKNYNSGQARYTEKTDIYALGVTIKKIHNYFFPPRIHAELCNFELCNLASKMTESNPSSRPGLEFIKLILINLLGDNNLPRTVQLIQRYNFDDKFVILFSNLERLEKYPAPHFLLTFFEKNIERFIADKQSGDLSLKVGSCNRQFLALLKEKKIEPNEAKLKHDEMGEIYGVLQKLWDTNEAIPISQNAQALFGGTPTGVSPDGLSEVPSLAS